MIKITKLEAEYIVESVAEIKTYLEDVADIEDAWAIIEHLENIDEIVRACLANIKSGEVYDLDESDLQHELERYANIETDTDR